MFDLNKCATAVAVAMIGTIRTGDDASRFSQRAIAEGHSSISELIAADAVKQAMAIRAELQVCEPITTTVQIPGVSPLQPVIDDMQEIEESIPSPTAIKFEAVEPAAGDVFVPLVPAPPVTEQVDTTSTSTTSEIASNVEVDSENLPWDGRIHSSSKARLAKDDSWKLKRNLDPAYVEQVKDELRQVMAIPKNAVVAAGTDSLPTSSTPTSETAQTAVETQGVLPDNNAFSPATVNKLVEQGNAAAVSVQADTKPSGVYSEYKLADLMRGITSKKLDPLYVAEVVKQFGVPSVPSLVQRPDLIPVVAEALQL